MGGTSDETIRYGLENLVGLCRACHSWIHLHPGEGYSSGFLVHSWQNPEDVPLRERTEDVLF
jgi:hypothetical protein